LVAIEETVLLLVLINLLEDKADGEEDTANKRERFG
jgi:hypothetical protein